MLNNKLTLRVEGGGWREGRDRNNQDAYTTDWNAVTVFRQCTVAFSDHS